MDDVANSLRFLPKRRILLWIAFAVVQASLVLLLALAVLRLWRYDLSTPFQYQSDALFFTVLVKGLLASGWPTHIAQLSAPLASMRSRFHRSARRIGCS